MHIRHYKSDKFIEKKSNHNTTTLYASCDMNLNEGKLTSSPAQLSNYYIHTYVCIFMHTSKHSKQTKPTKWTKRPRNGSINGERIVENLTKKKKRKTTKKKTSLA